MNHLIMVYVEFECMCPNILNVIDLNTVKVLNVGDRISKLCVFCVCKFVNVFKLRTVKITPPSGTVFTLLWVLNQTGRR